MQLEELLERSADRFPEKVAVVCGERRWTFRQIEVAANQLAGGLHGLGVRRGDRVVVFLDNSYEAVVAIFAVLKLGGVFVVVNPTTKRDKLGYLLRDCGAVCLFSDVRKLPVVEPILAQWPSRLCLVLTDGPNMEPPPHRAAWFDELVSGASSSVDPPAKTAIDVDLAALVYTSGSTGRPKGVMLTHRSMVSAAASITSYLENTADDVILNVLPLSFDYGLYQVLMACKVGATVVLERSFAYPGTIISRLREENVTGFPVVPTIVSLLSRLEHGSGPVLSGLRYVSSTGAPLSKRHIDDLRLMFPGARIYSMYGLTECKRVAYLPPDEIERRPLSVGRAMPNVETYIVDDEGRRLGPGAVGELVVRGSNLMLGYWGLAEDTARVLRPGSLPGERVLFTGDLFRADDEGFLYFVGRRDDIIKSRGEKVSPREVEVVILGCPGVVDAAVIGVADEVLGQAVTAFVTVNPDVGVTERSVLRHCAENLETFMVPTRVVICPELPMTPSGKIDKLKLAEA